MINVYCDREEAYILRVSSLHAKRTRELWIFLLQSYIKTLFINMQVPIYNTHSIREPYTDVYLIKPVHAYFSMLICIYIYISVCECECVCVCVWVSISTLSNQTRHYTYTQIIHLCVLVGTYRKTTPGVVYLQFSHAVSLVFNKAARPMLSLGITRLSMSSEPLELAIASWLNSIRCSLINVNLEKKYRDSCSVYIHIRHIWKNKSNLIYWQIKNN